MTELYDYSGEFKPDVKLQDFSKDALVKLIIAASHEYIGIDGLWLNTIRRRYGEEVAMDCSREVWDTGWLHEVRRGLEAMNISGNDIAAVFKYYQIDPGFGAMFDIKCELPSPDLGYVTVERCWVLDKLERLETNEMMQKIKLACEELDVPLFQRVASYFNPAIKVKPLKLPPRGSADEVACRWEYRME
ncbi:DUF6125 family protein [Chloroflexota bacterium]